MGLDPGDPLRFMSPSLRFSGLDFAGAAAGGDSSERRANSNLMGLSSTSSRLSMSMLLGDSELRRRTGVFSWPMVGHVIKGVALPSVVSAKARRRGLLDLLLRVRGDERRGPERRSENFFFAGTACASGDSGKAAMGLVGLLEAFGENARVMASGEMGERGGSELRSGKRDCLEGERERERRSSWRWEKWVLSRR